MNLEFHTTRLEADGRNRGYFKFMVNPAIAFQPTRRDPAPQPDPRAAPPASRNNFPILSARLPIPPAWCH